MSAHRPTVLIAGCGDLGTEIGLRFVERGARVIALRRNAAVLPASFEAQAVDLGRDTPVVPSDTDLVVIALAADAPTAEAYRAAYLDGLRNVLDALDAAGATPKRVLMVSSTAVYNVTDGSWIDEGTAATASSATGSVLVEAERLLHERVPSAIALRLAGIYGPGRTRLLDQVRGGAATASADGSFTNRIHRDDAAGAVIHLMTMDATPAPVYIGVDDKPVAMGEVLAFLADELGVPHPAVTASSGGRGGNKRCSNALLRATGFEFVYPDFRDGYRALIAGIGVRHP